ncbi:HI0074 family nucleotidyltransferase substrate-binding subunit [Ramlibacter sp.]|uniref:HI0074 family nucleotidyltransferase substrate-binding subunit n=1 Tax=Ramlibacter sp. TaxID=1917967 RepID=UPI003D0DA6A4
MSRQRFEQHRAQYDKALARLHEALRETETDIVRDAVIQRFEFTFEMAWLSLFDLLTLQGERVGKLASQVLPVAFRALLLDDPEDWDQIRAYRNLTSHTYNEAKAIEVAVFVRSTAIHAFDRLQTRLATL